MPTSAFTRYPQNVDRSGHSVGLRALMSLMWALAPSHRSVGCLLTALGCPASRMSGWRAVQEAGRAAARGMSERATCKAPVIGVDETIVKARGKAKLVGFVADAASGDLLVIDMPVKRARDGSLTDDGGMRLTDMEREVRNEPAPRRLAADLCGKWRSLLCHKRMRRARCEQCDGASDRQEQDKIQAAAGCKSVEGMMNGLWLTQRV